MRSAGDACIIDSMLGVQLTSSSSETINLFLGGNRENPKVEADALLEEGYNMESHRIGDHHGLSLLGHWEHRCHPEVWG